MCVCVCVLSSLSVTSSQRVFIVGCAVCFCVLVHLVSVYTSLCVYLCVYLGVCVYGLARLTGDPG